MAALRERRALLAIASVPHLGPVALHRVLGAFGRSGGYSCFFDLSAGELTRRFRLRPAAVEAVREQRDRLLGDAAALERELRERDVHWLAATEPDSPPRLAQAPWSPPPLLFTRGNEDLLDLPAVAFLNSSDAPPRALDLTDALADRLAAQGIAVVSGHNTPGYKAAAVAAARHGAPRLLVLDRGLISSSDGAFEREPVAPARVWSPEWDGLAGLALSPFRPGDGWARANSRRRDELVASLAAVLVAVHVRPGGVMEAIARAAGKSGAWLGVWEGGGAAGNAALLAEGRANVVPLPAAASFEELAGRIAREAAGAAGSSPPRHRAARRWQERERHFLYSLGELALGGPLDTDRLLDFGDRADGPPGPGATAAVRDAIGLGDPRPALQAALDALAEGAWLAARVDARALAAEGRDSFREWLAGQGWVAATVALPAGTGEEALAALMLRKGGPSAAPVLAVTPEAPVRSAPDHHRYLTEARARVQAHLTLRR